jgi:2,4-diaminopentanoate dehydrogenase
VPDAVSAIETPPIRAVLYGYGRVNHGALELAGLRHWLSVTGVIARSDRPIDGTGASGLAVHADAAATLAGARPEVVIVATRSRMTDVMPHLRLAVASGARAVLCTAEELAWVDPASADAIELRALAHEYGTAIVATGVNPGFVLDLWPLMLSGLAWDVASMHARRVSDVSVFSPDTRARLGIGHTAESFQAGLDDGTVVGHLGFTESLRILGDRMGRPTDDIRIVTEPVFAERRYQLPDGVVEAGQTIGALQRAESRVDGKPWITIELMVHAAPYEAGVPPVDQVSLEGRHSLRVTVEPGCGAILGTAAILVNSIPTALAARPGLYRAGDLPVSAPWLGHDRPPIEQFGEASLS